MRFQYLGTAAAEGFPAMFCNCESCKRARAAGGKSLRTRSQAVIDNRLLIDFPADTCIHVMRDHIPLHAIHTCLITHSHSDHLYAPDLEMRHTPYAQLSDPAPLTLYSTLEAGRSIDEVIRTNGLAREQRVFHQTVTPFVSFQADGYTITPLPANHAPETGPVIYAITDGDKTVLYAHDTGWFPDETWRWLRGNHPHFDLVSLDCTGGTLPGWIHRHMSLDTNIRVRDQLRAFGCVDETTRVVLNHFSHNVGAGLLYEEMAEAAAACGMEVSYDGLVIQL